MPQSPWYTPASEDEEEDMSSDEDIEAPYFAPKSAYTTPPNEDLRVGYYAMSKEDKPTQPSASESSGEDSVPDLIDLKEEHQPPAVPQKRAVHPTTLGLDKKKSLPEPTPLLSPTSKGKPGKPAVEVPLVTTEHVPEEEIIHIDDDRKPNPLQCMQQQFMHAPSHDHCTSCLLATNTICCDRQPPKVPERQEAQEQGKKKRSLAE